MTEFRFPWNIDRGDVAVIKGKFPIKGSIVESHRGGIRILNGSRTIPRDILFKVVGRLEDVEGDGNYCISSIEYSWDLGEMTSEYSPDKGESFIRIIPGDLFEEMELIEFATGLSYLYGIQFHIHTINKSNYTLTLEGTYDKSILSEIKSREEEIKEVFRFDSLDVIEEKRRGSCDEW